MRWYACPRPPNQCRCGVFCPFNAEPCGGCTRALMAIASQNPVAGRLSALKTRCKLFENAAQRQWLGALGQALPTHGVWYHCTRITQRPDYSTHGYSSQSSAFCDRAGKAWQVCCAQRAHLASAQGPVPPAPAPPRASARSPWCQARDTLTQAIILVHQTC